LLGSVPETRQHNRGASPRPRGISRRDFIERFVRSGDEVIIKPNQMHRNLDQRVADLASLVRSTLTVVDAVRILTAHRPTGGSLNDVQQTDIVIASHDIVAADACASTLFGLTGADVGYVQAAADMGLGTIELGDIKIEEINLSGAP
jgi:uncharacterized protein (DUF362 family)